VRTLSAVLEGPLRLAAILLSGAVLLGFALFVVQEAAGASEQSSAEIADETRAVAPSPTPRQERIRERRHSRAREAVDDVNDVLLAPFAWAAPEGSGAWAQHGLPVLLALLVYGLGLGYLARFTRGVG
jgi:hypothetical protein